MPSINDGTTIEMAGGKWIFICKEILKEKNGEMKWWDKRAENSVDQRQIDDGIEKWKSNDAWNCYA